jgi:hypothetical protein
MRFAITLHIDVPDGTDTDAFEMRGWFEERLEGMLDEADEDADVGETALNVVSCEQIPDDDP